VLVDAGVIKGRPAELQTMDEAAVTTGALVAGIAQAGADDSDAALTAVAEALATTVLSRWKPTRTASAVSTPFGPQTCAAA
jgi:hypothetical protein